MYFKPKEQIGLYNSAFEKDSCGVGFVAHIEGTEKLWEADLILLAMGFTGPEKDLPDQLGVDFDQKENIDTPLGSFATSRSGVFTAGDCRRGQSLVVWAINEGRGAALAIDKYLGS